MSSPTSTPPAPPTGETPPAPPRTQRAPLIYERLAACLASIKAVGKNGKNKDQHYDFRSIDDFYDAVQPALAEHAVFITPTILEHTREERITKNQARMLTTLVKVRFRLWTVDGSFVEADALGEGADSGDKSANKAASGAMKYLLQQVFAIRIKGEDLDTENESPEYRSAGRPTATSPRRAAPSTKPAAVAASSSSTDAQEANVAAMVKEYLDRLEKVDTMAKYQLWAKDANASPGPVRSQLVTAAGKKKIALAEAADTKAARAEADQAARAAEGPVAPTSPTPAAAAPSPAAASDGPCDEPPVDPATTPCVLRSGHDLPHRDANGAVWSYAPAREPAAKPKAPPAASSPRRSR